jgi:hypothetical protein
LFTKLVLRFYYFLFKKLTGVKKILTDSNHTTQYVFPDKTILGTFYDSYSRKHHLALYIPYKQLPRYSICKTATNFSPSKSERKLCPVCYEYLFKASRFKSLAKVILFAILKKEKR